MERRKRMRGPEFLIPIVLFICGAAAAIFVPITRAIAREIDGQGGGSSVPPELAAQIERMEHAIDSIAIEVERISEGQRFTTRLLAERNGGGAAANEAAVPFGAGGKSS